MKKLSPSQIKLQGVQGQQVKEIAAYLQLHELGVVNMETDFSHMDGVIPVFTNENISILAKLTNECY